jgi:hypothetical protein
MESQLRELTEPRIQAERRAGKLAERNEPQRFPPARSSEL